MPRNPENLDVFHNAHELVLKVYPLTESLPASERFGLVAQIRSAAASIPANIVEGCGRHSLKDYRRFIDMALGSAMELGYLLRLAVELELLTTKAAEDCRNRCVCVARQLNQLHSTLGAIAERDA
jgi:four helix bundle protein